MCALIEGGGLSILVRPRLLVCLRLLLWILRLVVVGVGLEEVGGDFGSRTGLCKQFERERKSMSQFV